jgi:peptidoglycan/xylan/chitin deacetylase (PgdA/CDA1 family)
MRTRLPRVWRLLGLALVLFAAGLIPPGEPAGSAAAPGHVLATAADAVDGADYDPDLDRPMAIHVKVVPHPPVLITIERARPTPAPRLGGTYVPILLYHYIRYPIPGDRQGFGLSVPPPMFHQQMQYLAANGFHVISLHDAVEAVLGRQRLPSRPVVLTFDDGYADFFTAAVPELRYWGFTATSFVVTGRIGWASYMTWSEIQAADAMGFTIGAHTVHHVALSSLPAAQARWEMQQSRDTLAAVLGHPILDFAYPYGSLNGSLMATAHDLGFECAVSTIGSPWHWRDELYYMYRLRIGGGFTMYDFARWVGGPPYRPGASATPPPAVIPTPASAPSPTPAPTASSRPSPAAASPSP